VPPRLYGIVAQRAPVAVIFYRGPSRWSRFYRWRLDTGELECGAWMKARVYPHRCDLSPNGEFLLYYAANWSKSRTEKWPAVYVALSRTPWAFALAAHQEIGTWGRGFQFSEAQGDSDWSGWFNRHERVSSVLFGPAPHAVRAFAVELLHGWVESSTHPAREARDAWDEKHDVRVERAQPKGRHVLTCLRRGWPRSDELPEFQYELRDGTGRVCRTLDAQWADWSPEGSLLEATLDGRLLRSRLESPSPVESEHDLRDASPEPTPAPEWARDP
jgi:hypothetical protein